MVLRRVGELKVAGATMQPRGDAGPAAIHWQYDCLRLKPDPFVPIECTFYPTAASRTGMCAHGISMSDGGTVRLTAPRDGHFVCGVLGAGPWTGRALISAGRKTRLSEPAVIPFFRRRPVMRVGNGMQAL